MKKEESNINLTHLSLFLSLALRITCWEGLCSQMLQARRDSVVRLLKDNASRVLISAKPLFRGSLRYRLGWCPGETNSGSLISPAGSSWSLLSVITGM